VLGDTQYLFQPLRQISRRIDGLELAIQNVVLLIGQIGL
jgi:hypothetical protein